MKKIIKELKKLRKNKAIKSLVKQRLALFKKLGKQPSRQLFKELCFCILTANFDAAKAIVIQQKIGNGFLEFSEKQLEKKLKQLGYRYPNRADRKSVV